VNSLNTTGGTDLDGASGTTANPLYIFKPTHCGGGSAALHECGDDRSQPDRCRGLGQGTGDNTNAAAMANLANQSIVSGLSPTNYFSNFVSTLGATVSGVQAENTAQNASVTQLQTQTMRSPVSVWTTKLLL